MPAAAPFKARVLIDHRIADEATVRSECYWRNRRSGAKLHEGPPGCSWTENGVAVVLCTDPKSFNNAKALEVCGHEAFHQHDEIDHK